MPKRCKHCGKELPPKKKNGPPARYCNAVCKARYWDSRNLPVDKPNGYHCYICGQELIGKRIKQCASCYADAAERKQQKKQERLAKVCKHCGGTLPSQGPGRRRKFCSDECQRAWWVANRDQGKVYTFTCQNCGKEYETNYSNRDSCCSLECSWEYVGKLNSERAIINKRCFVCKTVFQGMASGTDYCSDACRRRAYTNTCVQCGKEFVAERSNATTCSDECRQERDRRRGREYHRAYKKRIGRNAGRVETLTCEYCGKQFQHEIYNQVPRYCSKTCTRRANEAADPERYARIRAMSRHRRRARKYGNGPVDAIDPIKVFKRDSWRCGICGKKVNPKLQHPHPNSASLDHIIPLARGGTHTWGNVQLAHLACNSAKRDVGGGQLRLGIAHETG